MIDNSTKDKLENETPHFGNTLLYAVADLKRYSTIVVDPPWEQKNMAKWKRRPNTAELLPYKTMSITEIENLPLQKLADNNCHLWIWTTNQFMPDAINLCKQWGFKYLSTITWVKPSGVGAWFVNRTQHLIFGYKGKLKMNKRYLPTVYFDTPKRHSEKPESFYELFESVSSENRLEMFARREREGWDVFGNEVSNSIDLERYHSNGI